MKTNRPAVVVLGMVLMAALVVVLTRLQVSTDMGAFLPHGGAASEQVMLEQLRSGSSARVILLAIRGDEPAQLARLSNELSLSLRRHDRFERVLNGEMTLELANESPWFEYRYLLQESEFSVATLQRSLQQRLQEVKSPLGLYTRQTLATDPTASFRQMLQQWQGGVHPQTRHGVWFSTDDRALLFVQTRAAGYDLDAQQQNLEAVRRAFAGLEGGEQAELMMTGAPVIALSSRDTIRSEARLASIAATLAVALILLLAYRSPRLWLLSALPLAAAMVAALAVTTLLFGTVHGITIAFGITLLGVAIDYPIHLFSHLTPGQPPGVSLQRIWPTLRLGVLSTLVGFVALLFTRFDGLLQLGVFAVSGLVMAALVTRYLLLPLLPSNWHGRDYGAVAAGAATGGWWRMPLVLLVLLVALGYLAVSEGELWEQDLAALSPVPEAMQRQDRELRGTLPVAELNHMLLLRAGDPESVLRLQERLLPLLQRWVDEGWIDGYGMASQRLASAALQRERQARLPESEPLQRNLTQALQGLPFRADSFEPFVEAVERSRELAPLTLGQVVDTNLGLPLAELIFERQGQWWGIVRLAGVADAAALRQSAEQADAAVSYLDLRAEAGTMLDGFRDNALRNLLWGALAIILIIGVSVRSLRRMVQVVLPLAAALSTTVALLHLLGERLTLFHLTSLLLVAGIGIDYNLFFSRGDAVRERARTFHALGVCAISTSVVFAILAISRLPVLHAIGLTVLLGVPAVYLLARLAGGGVTENAAATAGARANHSLR